MLLRVPPVRFADARGGAKVESFPTRQKGQRFLYEVKKRDNDVVHRFLALVAVAASASGCGGGASEQLSLEEARLLPLRASLGNLCPGASSPEWFERKLMRQAEALIRAVSRDPDSTVMITEYFDDDPPRRVEVTVSELAEQGSQDLDNNGPCMKNLRNRLQAAIDAG